MFSYKFRDPSDLTSVNARNGVLSIMIEARFLLPYSGLSFVNKFADSKRSQPNASSKNTQMYPVQDDIFVRRKVKTSVVRILKSCADYFMHNIQTKIMTISKQ